MKTKIQRYQPGAASLIIVMFTTILVGILTVGFVRIMLKDWDSASQQDLSTSAYDSALAGVEDAKTAMGIYNNICTKNAAVCNKLREQHLNGKNCDAIGAIRLNENNTRADLAAGTGSLGNNEEQRVGYSESNNQAYTCVTINLNTSDYISKFDSKTDQVVVPLKGEKEFTKVRLSWYQTDDKAYPGRGIETPGGLYRVDDASTLPSYKDVSDSTNRESNPDRNVPPMIVSHYFKRTADLTHYDIKEDPGYGNSPIYKVATTNQNSRLNNSTLFLNPTSNWAGASEVNFADRHSLDSAPENLVSNIKCNNNVTGEQYACEAIVVLPLDGGRIPAYSADHFMRLSRRYNTDSVTSFKLELLNSSNQVVNFAGVQPMVDSNGRANDFMRRVEARIESLGGSGFPYPSAAVEVGGEGLIKDFGVTDSSCNGSGDVCNNN